MLLSRTSPEISSALMRSIWRYLVLSWMYMAMKPSGTDPHSRRYSVSSSNTLTDRPVVTESLSLCSPDSSKCPPKKPQFTAESGPTLVVVLVGSIASYHFHAEPFVAAVDTQPTMPMTPSSFGIEVARSALLSGRPGAVCRIDANIGWE